MPRSVAGITKKSFKKRKDNGFNSLIKKKLAAVHPKHRSSRYLAKHIVELAQTHQIPLPQSADELQNYLQNTMSAFSLDSMKKLALLVKLLEQKQAVAGLAIDFSDPNIQKNLTMQLLDFYSTCGPGATNRLNYLFAQLEPISELEGLLQPLRDQVVEKVFGSYTASGGGRSGDYAGAESIHFRNRVFVRANKMGFATSEGNAKDEYINYGSRGVSNSDIATRIQAQIDQDYRPAQIVKHLAEAIFDLIRQRTAGKANFNDPEGLSSVTLVEAIKLFSIFFEGKKEADVKDVEDDIGTLLEQMEDFFICEDESDIPQPK